MNTATPRNYLAQSLREEQQRTLSLCASHTARTIGKPPVYSGITALRISGIEVPYCISLKPCTFHVLYDERSHRASRSNTRYLLHHNLQSTHGIMYIDHQQQRIRFTHPIMTWALLASHLSQVEIIVLADAILRSTLQWIKTSIDDIRRFLENSAPFPSKKRCLAALPFLETVPDSPMEKRSVLALLRYGLPYPETQWSILIPAFGRTATVDMAYPQQKVIIEYDGDAHRQDKRQYRWDERKRQALRAMGYTVIVVFADDIVSKDGRFRFAQRVADALRCDISDIPKPQYKALLSDDRRERARLKQQAYRRREARKGRKV